MCNPKYFFFVAEDNGNVNGYICGTVKIKNFQVEDTEGAIKKWFVSEVYRHKGVGNQLYEALIEEFKKAHCTHVALKVFVDNKTTIAMYHKMGFIDLELTLVKKLE